MTTKEWEKAKATKGRMLSEALIDIPQDADIRVGSGSGWLFFGKNTDTSCIELEFEKMRKAKMARHKKNAQTQIRTKKEKTRIERQKANKKIEEYLRNYTPALNRKVKDVYLDMYRHDVCIVIEGDEQSDYWTKEEWENERG